jgi:hypothetical protein
LAWLSRRKRPKAAATLASAPLSLDVIVPVRDESAQIEEKLEDLAALRG